VTGRPRPRPEGPWGPGPSIDAGREAAVLRERIAALGTPKRAAGAKAYMRSSLKFTGTSVPDLRRVAGAWLREHKTLEVDDLRAVAQAMWTRPAFEERLLAAILLQRRASLLRPADLPWLETIARSCQAWALLDTFVFDAIAHVLAQSPALRKRTLTRWSKDGDFWVRRTALLTMMRELARGEGDWPLWTTLARSQLEDQARWATSPPSEDERFFIRKALGWTLRARGEARPDDVVAFVRANRPRLSGLTLREATRRLPAAHRARLGLGA
jgi:3-methyladenine DNA glycosylase AlkD